MKVQLFIGGVQLDLFDDESMTVKKVLKDIRDPKKIFTDFSRGFTVPASKTNNKVFKHYYRQDVTNGIDGRSMLSAEIRINFLTFGKGNVEIQDVQMRDGKPFSYKLTFYGELTEMRKKIGNDELSALNLSTLDHDSSPENIDSLMSHGADSVVYPLTSKGDRLIHEAGGSPSLFEGVSNIAYGASTQATGYGVSKSDLSAFVKVKNIIDAIELDYDLTFEGALKEDTVNELYLRADRELNNDNAQKVIDGYVTTSGGTTFDNGTIFIPLPSSGIGLIKLNLLVTSAPSSDYTVKVKSAGITIGEFNSSSADLVNGNEVQTQFIGGFSDNYQLTMTIEGNSGDSIAMTVTADVNGNTFNLTGSVNEVNNSTHVFTVTDFISENFITSQMLPSIKVLDFLSSIMQRFNIIAYVEDGVIKTEFYDVFLSRGETKNIDAFFDMSSFSISRPNPYASIDFNSKSAGTLMEDGYSAVNGADYGQLKYRLKDEDGNNLTGDEYKIESKSTILPLDSIDTDIAYAYYVDSNYNKKDTGLTFHYLVNATGSIAYDNGADVQEVTEFQIPSNVRKTDTGFFNGLYYGEEMDEITQSTQYFGNGIFNVFHANQTSLMFDKQKRIYRGKATLPVSFLTNLSLADRLSISNKLYIINSFNANFTTGETDLELISIDQTTSNLFSSICRDITATSDSQVLYMASDGVLTNQTILAGETMNICSIGLIKASIGSFTSEELQDGTGFTGATAPIAQISVNGTVTSSYNAAVGETLTLASASYDLDGTIISKSWGDASGSLGNAGTISYTKSTSGISVVVLYVVDNDGNGSAATLTINFGNDTDTPVDPNDPTTEATTVPPCADTCPAGTLTFAASMVGTDASAFQVNPVNSTYNYTLCECGDPLPTINYVVEAISGEVDTAASLNSVTVKDSDGEIRAIYDNGAGVSTGIFDFTVTSGGGFVNVAMDGNIPQYNTPDAQGNYINAYTVEIDMFNGARYSTTVNVTGSMSHVSIGNVQRMTNSGWLKFSSNTNPYQFAGDPNDLFGFTFDIDPDSGYSLDGAGYIQDLVFENKSPNAQGNYTSVISNWDGSANGGNGRYTIQVTGSIGAEDRSVDLNFNGTAVASPATTMDYEYSFDNSTYYPSSSYVPLTDAHGEVYIKFIPDGSWYSTLGANAANCSLERFDLNGDPVSSDNSGDQVVWRLTYSANESLTENRIFSLKTHPRASSSSLLAVKFNQESQDGTNTTTTTAAPVTTTTSGGGGGTTSTAATTTSGGGGGGGTTAAPTQYYYFSTSNGFNVKYDGGSTGRTIVHSGMTDCDYLTALYSTTSLNTYNAMPSITGNCTTTAPVTTTTTTQATTTSPPNNYPYYSLEDENGAGGFSYGGSQYNVGDFVSVSGLSGCWEIIGTGQSTTQYNSVTGSCTPAGATTTTTTTTTAAPTSYAHTLYFDASSASGACSGSAKTVYTAYNRDPLQNGDTIYRFSDLSGIGAAGYRSNGSDSRYWSGSSWSGSITGCA